MIPPSAIFLRWARLLVLVLLSLLPLEALAQSEARVALVIGNANYASQPLRNPANDARAMAGALRSVGFDVTELVDADQNSMKRAIEEFGRKLQQSGGVGLFFFAGHGVQVNGRNYLVPIGANITSEGDVDIESVDMARVLAKMDAARTRINLVILDACRNNPFSRSYRSADRGLAFVSAPQGTLIAFATAPGSVAADGEGGNGVYTGALVNQLRTPGMKVEDVFKAVRTSVKSQTQGQQVPWESSSLEGDFAFMPGSGVAPATTTTTTKPSQPRCPEGTVPAEGGCTTVKAAPPPAGPERSIGPQPAQPQPLPAPEEDHPPPPPSSRGGSTLKTLGFVSAGVGVVGIGTGAVIALMGADTKSTLEGTCEGSRCPASAEDDVDKFNTMKTLSTVGYVAGGALLGVGIALIVAAPSSEKSSRGPSVTPVVGLGHVGAVGQF